MKAGAPSRTQSKHLGSLWLTQRLSMTAPTSGLPALLQQTSVALFALLADHSLISPPRGNDEAGEYSIVE
jgi:hypothetical protein